MRRVGVTKALGWAPVGIAVALAALFRLLATAGPAPAQFPDAQAYLEQAATPLGSLAFWLGPRPPTLPLILKLVGTAPAQVAIAQVCFSVLAWGWLAVVAAKSQTSVSSRCLVAVGVLATSLATEVVQWDRLILTESLSLTLMATLLAGALELAREWRPWRGVVVVALAVLWSQTRDANGLMLGVIGAALAGANLLRLRARRWFVMAGAAVAICAVSQAASGASDRWAFPFYNVVAHRILPDAQAREFFASRGMPITPSLLRLNGQWGSSQDGAMLRDPALAGFRAWSRAHGRATYTAMLASHPAAALGRPWNDRASIIAPDVSKYRVPTAVTLADVTTNPVVTWLACAAAVIALLLGRRLPPAAMLLGCSVVASLALSVVVWYADAMEVPRHELMTSVQMRLCGWLLLGHVPWAAAWQSASRTVFTAFERRPFRNRVSQSP